MSSRLRNIRDRSSGFPVVVVPGGTDEVDADARRRGGGARSASSAARSTGWRRAASWCASALASTSSSAMSCSRRCDCRTARRAISGHGARSGWARPTSSPVRMAVSGLRSSCEASATKRRCRAADVLQPGQHVVHRAGQAADLVVGAGLRDALRQVGAGDRGDRAADLLHRPQRAPDHQPHRAAGQHQQDRHADHQQPGERLVDLAAQVGAGRGDDGDRLAADRGVLAVVGQIVGQHRGPRPACGPAWWSPARACRVAGRPASSAWRPSTVPSGASTCAWAVGSRSEAGSVRGNAAAGRGLLDLGGVGAQLAVDRLVSGVQLQPVHHHQPQHHRRGERQAGHHGDPGADRAGTGPADQPPPAPGRRAHAAGARGHAWSRMM